jgi:predicted ATP-grasp superfamily ATP-dependent carboligase
MTQSAADLLGPAGLTAISGPSLDRAVPALVLKVGQYPVHSGGLGVIRTLGRLGVPVYAITEPGLTPAVASRYCTAAFVWHATGREEPAQLVAQLSEVGESIGRPTVVVPVDDEAAVLVAEHQAELSGRFLFPRVQPRLPRKLASKPGLYDLCIAHGVPAPTSVTPATFDEAGDFAATATYPVVVKNAEVWERRRRPVVPGTTIVPTEDDLLALLTRPPPDLLPDRLRKSPRSVSPGVILQEYIPPEDSEDWIVHLYGGADSASQVMFTGRKIRSWPPTHGVTACAYSVANPQLADIARTFCDQIGFQGIADLDVRLDLRDGRYKLVDFNPRAGNQFRLFESESGVDVVRAQHLDLTGRPIPPGRQVDGRRIIVEHADIPAQLAYRRLDKTVTRAGSARPAHTSTEFAWLARDDPFPFVVMVRHVIGAAWRKLRQRG